MRLPDGQVTAPPPSLSEVRATPPLSVWEHVKVSDGCAVAGEDARREAGGGREGGCDLLPGMLFTVCAQSSSAASKHELLCLIHFCFFVCFKLRCCNVVVLELLRVRFAKDATLKKSHNVARKVRHNNNNRDQRIPSFFPRFLFPLFQLFWPFSHFVPIAALF